MKKIFYVLLLAFALMLTACSSQSGNSANVNSGNQAVQPNNTAQGKILIAYFSWSGNTKQLAEMIQGEVGGDLFAITPANPYTDDYNALLDIAQKEQRDKARPELAEKVSDFDSYNMIFVGYPNWWSDTPMAVLTFLESYDFNGKTVIPFCTHGSSGFGRSVDSVKSSAKGANFLDGFEVRGANVGSAKSSVSKWISGLNLG